MTTWRYIKGSEKDFEGAPDWTLYRGTCKGLDFWSEGYEVGERYQRVNNFAREKKYKGNELKSTIIAQREPVVTNDNINHPLRYTKGDIECIDAIKAATVGKTGIEAVDVGHVIRYLWRYEEKDGLESVKRAEWYIKHLINELENNK